MHCLAFIGNHIIAELPQCTDGRLAHHRVRKVRRKGQFNCSVVTRSENRQARPAAGFKLQLNGPKEVLLGEAPPSNDHSISRKLLILHALAGILAGSNCWRWPALGPVVRAVRNPSVSRHRTQEPRWSSSSSNLDVLPALIRQWPPNWSAIRL